MPTTFWTAFLSVACRPICSLAMRILLMVVVAGGQQCKKGLSLLAHKTSLQKSRWYDGYWCPCGGNLDQCSGLLQTSTASPGLCQREGCGEDYPQSPESCLSDHDRPRNSMGTCVHVWGKNCLYTSELIETNSTCGVRNCTCTTVAPGECTATALPGYTIVQNGASPMTVGGQATLANGSVVELEDQRAWELVGGAGNHACRGDNSSDNDPKHYQLITYINSLWGCKNKCERTWDCRGIEYSPGRCELWKRQEGLFAYKEIPVEKGEFTCLRYGWPTKKLVPAGPGPCRGRSSTDNHRSNYHLAQVYKYNPDRPHHTFGSKEGFKDIEECKALCAATFDGEFAQCTGIEWSPGRCEIWQVMIESTNPNVSGFTCLKFQV